MKHLGALSLGIILSTALAGCDGSFTTHSKEASPSTIGSSGSGASTGSGTGTGSSSGGSSGSPGAPLLQSVSYSVSGLTSGGLLGVELNGAYLASIAKDGSYYFVDSANQFVGLAPGVSYNVTVSSQPAGETCTVANGSGTIPNGPVALVPISCVAASSASLTPEIHTEYRAGIPGARQGSVSWSNDHQVWMFGGQASLGTDGIKQFNDFWRYSEGYGVWEPILDGSSPAGRSYAAAWIDVYGTLWMFGGQSTSEKNASTVMSDLWNFSPASGRWEEVSTQSGPSARMQSVTWTDSAGNFWLSGGFGVAADGTLQELQDMWCFDVQTQSWKAQAGVTGI